MLIVKIIITLSLKQKNMKKNLWLLLLPLVVAFSSCDKDEEVDYTSAYANASIVTNAGTTAFNAVKVNAAYSETGLVKLTVTFDGKSGGEYIVLGIKAWDKNSGTGVFSVGTTSSATAIGAYHKPNSSADEIASTGQIVVTKFAANIISGTFYFTTPATQVTSGAFEAKVAF
jgi:hypothetical protein